MRTWPTLYKKNSNGSLQGWSISVEGASIYRSYGQVGGAEISSQEEILEGKNIGRSNETSPEEQAEREAEAEWVKMKKKGYVESLEGARAGERDKLIEGGVEPMLAQPFSKHGAKIRFPAYLQPKLDGIRCIAVVKDGQCTLWTRTRKRISSVPHIERALAAAIPTGEVTLDGELYNHALARSGQFEKIISLCRQEKPADEHEIVEYHLYDVVSPRDYGERLALLASTIVAAASPFIKLVETEVVSDAEAITEAFGRHRADGYEGAMVRQAKEAPYEHKRSFSLQKVKEFDDAEFRIIGASEGRGKLAGHVGAFVLTTAGGETFEAKLKGELCHLKTLWENPSLWEGKLLTVQYQGLTGKAGVPRFPVGVRIRDGAE